jgi:protein-S-isoprenylcysteine O-methyltransferase Ste14
VTPQNTLPVLWITWVISWALAGRWASKPSRVESGPAVVFYRATSAVGFLLIILTIRNPWPPKLWQPSEWQAYVLDGCAFIGFAFTWWARIHLGQLWSSSVTIKPDHRIVDTGPYGIVRHPIYTGLLLAIAAAVGMNGTVGAVFGGLLMLTGIVSKAKLEETVLRSEFGSAAYDAYANKVPMLVPFAHLKALGE